MSRADGLTWTLTLREGLRFHDGEPVRAQDAAASIRRWGARDAFGQALMAAAHEVSATDDRTVTIRLKKPFPLLPNALGKTMAYPCMVMPERVAKSDAFKAITETVGSGPYRFVANERVAGARLVFERFQGYVPRKSGTPQLTSGPKVANFDRIEWTIMHGHGDRGGRAAARRDRLAADAARPTSCPSCARTRTSSCARSCPRGWSPTCASTISRRRSTTRASGAR